MTIVGAFGMLRIELRDRRLRLDLERRIELHRPGLRCQQHHVGDVGAPKDAVGHEIVGDLGGVIDADDRNQRSLAFRRLQRRKSGVGFFLRDRRRGSVTVGAGGRDRIHAPMPTRRRLKRDSRQRTAPTSMHAPIHGHSGLSRCPSADREHQTAVVATASGITLAVAVATASVVSFESLRDASRWAMSRVAMHDTALADDPARPGRPEKPHVEIQRGLKLVGVQGREEGRSHRVVQHGRQKRPEHVAHRTCQRVWRAMFDVLIGHD